MPINILSRVASGALRSLYSKTIREHTPEKYRLLSGVAVMGIPALESQHDEQDYKKGLITSIRRFVHEGDTVEIVGFGRGVSTIHAFDAGADSVTAHEAAEEMIEVGRQTVRVNRPFGVELKIKQTIVGNPKSIYGDSTDAESIRPGNLSGADVLILDCEGSELSIIENLGTYPDTVIIETHPEHQTPTDPTVRALPGDYAITVVDYHPDFPEKDVIRAVREGSHQETTNG